MKTTELHAWIARVMTEVNRKLAIPGFAASRETIDWASDFIAVSRFFTTEAMNATQLLVQRPELTTSDAERLAKKLGVEPVSFRHSCAHKIITLQGLLEKYLETKKYFNRQLEKLSSIPGAMGENPGRQDLDVSKRLLAISTSLEYLRRWCTEAYNTMTEAERKEAAKCWLENPHSVHWASALSDLLEGKL